MVAVSQRPQRLIFALFGCSQRSEGVGREGGFDKIKKTLQNLPTKEAGLTMFATRKQIAKFMDVSLTSAELEQVTKQCTLEHMKSVDRFGYLMPLNTDGADLWDTSKDTIMTKGAMTVTGGVGTGKARFTDKVKEMWKKAEEDKFGHDPKLLKWAREGGPFN